MVNLGSVLVAILYILFLIILTNVSQQLLFKRQHEPPVVFHWVPIIGSTLTYGVDPIKFFFDCQAKVSFFTLTPSGIRSCGGKR